MAFRECTIIVKSAKEKKEFIKSCQHLHDFTVWLDNLSPKERLKIRTQDIWSEPKKRLSIDIIGVCLDLDRYPFVNFLAGLADCEDYKIRNKFIKVRRVPNPPAKLFEKST